MTLEAWGPGRHPASRAADTSRCAGRSGTGEGELWVNVRASARLAEAPCATHEPVRLVELPDARRVDTRHHEVKVGREVGVVVGRDARVTEHAPGGVDDARVRSAPRRIRRVVPKCVRHGVGDRADWVAVARIELRVADVLRPHCVHRAHCVRVVRRLQRQARVAHPPLALVALRAVGDDGHEVAPNAPLDGVRELVERLRRVGKGKRAHVLDARADKQPFDRVERGVGEAGELNVSKTVVRELRLPDLGAR